MPNLQQLLEDAEGMSYKVYKDPVKKNRPTVGIGHLVVAADKLKVGDVIDEARVKAFFKKDTATALAAAKKQASLAGISNTQFIVYLAAVNFQLGPGWYKIHKKTWAFIMQKKYDDASNEVLKSAWAKQTPKRVKTFRKGLLLLSEKVPEPAK